MTCMLVSLSKYPLPDCKNEALGTFSYFVVKVPWLDEMVPIAFVKVPWLDEIHFAPPEKP